MKYTTVALVMILACAGCSPAQKSLHDAAKNRTTADITALVDAGADPNARDMFDSTPLHGAALFNKNPAIITTLLKSGANIEARKLGSATPLHVAAAAFPVNPEAITALLKAGADHRAQNEEGLTPFDLAKENYALQETDDYWRLLNQLRF